MDQFYSRKYTCIKTVFMDGGTQKAFIKGKDYYSINLEFHPVPESAHQVCLVDRQGDPHYVGMPNGKFIKEHFIKERP